jgi:hypothetical protein
LVRAVTSEPPSTVAWAIGAEGEEALGADLDAIPGIRVLHDRCVPGGQANLDHLVVAPAGVFIVDAKHYEGLIEVRNHAWFLRPDWRLTVGRRDKSKLAHAMGWQVAAVEAALRSAGVEPLPSMTPVLCFVDGRWPIFCPPAEFAGVRLESERSIKALFTKRAELDTGEIERLSALLARELPAK